MKEVHHILFRLDSVQTRFESALANFVLSKKYSDSLLNSAKNKQIAELQIQYETDKKDKDLALREQSNQLLKKQSKLQQSRLLQTLQIWPLSGVAKYRQLPSAKVEISLLGMVT